MKNIQKFIGLTLALALLSCSKSENNEEQISENIKIEQTEKQAYQFEIDDTWKDVSGKYSGAYFDVEVPKGGYKVKTDGNSSRFMNKNRNVEIYLFTDGYQLPYSEMISEDGLTFVKKDAKQNILLMHYKANDESYSVIYEFVAPSAIEPEELDDIDQIRFDKVIGIKFTNREAFNNALEDFETMKSTLITFADEGGD